MRTPMRVARRRPRGGGPAATRGSSPAAAAGASLTSAAATCVTAVASPASSAAMTFGHGVAGGVPLAHRPAPRPRRPCRRACRPAHPSSSRDPLGPVSLGDSPRLPPSMFFSARTMPVRAGVAPRGRLRPAAPRRRGASGRRRRRGERSLVDRVEDARPGSLQRVVHLRLDLRLDVREVGRGRRPSPSRRWRCRAPSALAAGRRSWWPGRPGAPAAE